MKASLPSTCFLSGVIQTRVHSQVRVCAIYIYKGPRVSTFPPFWDWVFPGFLKRGTKYRLLTLDCGIDGSALGCYRPTNAKNHGKTLEQVILPTFSLGILVDAKNHGKTLDEVLALAFFSPVSVCAFHGNAAEKKCKVVNLNFRIIEFSSKFTLRYYGLHRSINKSLINYGCCC